MAIFSNSFGILCILFFGLFNLATSQIVRECERQGGVNLNIYCGRGSNGQCPRSSYCDIHPSDAFATCCCNDSLATCPNCTHPVNCFADPCQFASCFPYPSARCESDYCGGCNARFYVGETEVTANCSMPIQPCQRYGGTDTNIYCGLGSNGECPARSYCDIHPTDAFANCCCNDSLATCPNCTYPVNCFADPCQFSSCFPYPSARCESDYCGGCNARFYVGEKEVTENCSMPIQPCQRYGGTDTNIYCGLGSNGECPARSYCDIHPSDAFANCCCNDTAATCPNCTYPVNCFADPCQFSNCLAYPSARCESDYCGGCNARFYVGEKEVTNMCNMPIQPCQRYGGTDLNIFCGRGSSGQCPGSSYCDIHPADSFATCCCEDDAATCPNCTSPVNCAINPCNVNTCKSFPTAVCRANYCGGCNAQFFKPGDEEVTSQCDLITGCNPQNQQCIGSSSVTTRPLGSLMMIMTLILMLVHF